MLSPFYRWAGFHAQIAAPVVKKASRAAFTEVARSTPRSNRPLLELDDFSRSIHDKSNDEEAAEIVESSL